MDMVSKPRLGAIVAALSASILLVGLTGATPLPAGAQSGSEAGDPYADIELQHAFLGELGLESPAYQAAVAEYDNATEIIEAARVRIGQIEHQLIDLRSAQTQLDDGIPALEERIGAARQSVEQAQSEMAELMVIRYVIEGSKSDLATFDPNQQSRADDDRRSLVIETVAASRRHQLDRSTTILADAETAVAIANESTVTVAERISGLEQELDSTRTLLAATEDALPGLEQRVDEERQKSRLTGTDLTVVALDAYTTAAALAAAEQPECRLHWTLLAGIGRVESRHGTYRGSTLLPNGSVSKPIIGIALDGSMGTAVIPDSDGGVLDGDIVWDRAVGPMQFIPSTWRSFAADGNGDGVSDPQNVYDAALAAARYLCRRGPLDVDSNVRSAILTYNNSDVYVRAVRANASVYADMGIELRQQ